MQITKSPHTKLHLLKQQLSQLILSSRNKPCKDKKKKLSVQKPKCFYLARYVVELWKR